MQITGLCAICGRPAKPAYTCRFCGAIVCSNCFDASSGLCKNCAARIKKGNH